MPTRSTISASLSVAASCLVMLSSSPPSASEKEVYSPYANEHHATDVFWGDTHVHSSWSPDAGGSGNRMITPSEAYRFARGETIEGHAGEPVALRRPLDFLVVADHSEALGLFPLLQERNPTLLSTDNGKRWLGLLEAGQWGEIGFDFAMGLSSGRNPFGNDEARGKIARTMWDRVVANADRFNQPGVFTAFIGYEWTSMPNGANLHRIVMFRDGAERAGQVLPFSSIDSEDPEDLWRYLADYEARTGGDAFAIPHNSNLSAGRMFELSDFRGEARSGTDHEPEDNHPIKARQAASPHDHATPHAANSSSVNSSGDP